MRAVVPIVILIVMLPGCGPGRTGADRSPCTVTPAARGAVITCTDGSVAVILDGADGTDGVDGVDGTDGTAGAWAGVTETFECAGGIEDLSMIYSYRYNRLATGDVWVHATVADSAFQVSGSAYYTASEWADGSGGVMLVRDVWEYATFGYWVLGLHSMGDRIVIEYHDDDVSLRWTQPTYECTRSYVSPGD